MLRKNPGRFDYQVWFQSAEAEAELSADPYYTVKCTIRGTGADDVKGFLEAADPSLVAQAPTVKGGLLKGFPPKARCPRSEILTEDELRYYGAQFSRSGYFGALSWYRNVERNWRWMCSTAGQKVLQPALILTAGRDPVLKASMVESLKMKDWIPSLVHRHIEESGHWVLQEKPAEANKHICDWSRSLLHTRLAQKDSPAVSAEEEVPEEAPPAEVQLQALSPHVLRHAENIRITNDSLFPANVRLGLASAGGDFAVGDDIKGPSPFIVEPDNIKLGVNQDAEVKIWCFPPEKGVYNDRIVARIEHNPEPVAFNLCAVGEVPALSLEKEEVDFGRLMMNIRADDQRVKIKNESSVPVRWQLLCKESKVLAEEKTEKVEGEEGDEAPPGPRLPEELGVEPTEGLLSGNEERDIRLSFRSARAAQFSASLLLESRDAEGLNSWQQAAKLSVAAESFAVDAVIEPDPREVALDFGTVLVHSSVQRTFDIVNRGKFPVRLALSGSKRYSKTILNVVAMVEFTDHCSVSSVWCRTERVARELSTRKSGYAILVESAVHQTVLWAGLSMRDAPGEGKFTLDGDREVIGRIVTQMVWSKLFYYLEHRQLHNYRFLLNAQTAQYFRSLDVEPIDGLVPGFHAETDPSVDCKGFMLERFLHQNCFRNIFERDAAGWPPICFAAMSNNVVVLDALLDRKVDINQATTKPATEVNLPAKLTALGIAGLLSNNEAVELLLCARAHVNYKDGFGGNALHIACAGDNPHAVRLLCHARANVNQQAGPGMSPLMISCACGSRRAMKEMLTLNPDLSLLHCLHVALMFASCGSADLVSDLLDARANVNEQFRVQIQEPGWWLLMNFMGLRHRVSSSRLTLLAYHHYDATPLMFSILSGSLDAVSSLLSARAQVDIQNYRKNTASDLARQMLAPSWLIEVCSTKGQEGTETLAQSDTFFL
ncbi:Ephx2 [Symbiodinium sp. CCMP2456]|nr:Ephx2 [Symbiodinium sp. CCMP2456]